MTGHGKRDLELTSSCICILSSLTGGNDSMCFWWKGPQSASCLACQPQPGVFYVFGTKT
jgi:hypothetical protein